MAVPAGFVRIGDRGDGAVVRSDLAAVPLSAWWASGAPLVGAPGRGQVRILEAGGVRGAARSYRRGGALRALDTRFLGRSRAQRELAVLAALRAKGVPAVDPLAAVWQRRGLFYRMRLVTRFVDDSLPLPAFLVAQPARARAAVREAGRVVRAAFDAGLDHPDLHPDNLLVSCAGDALRVQLLDLDRCALRALLHRDRDRMLLRMARYLERHGAGLAVRGRVVDQLRFLSGMGFDRRARRAELTRLHPAYERAVLRHRVAWSARSYRAARSSLTSSSSSARPSSA